MKPLNMFCILAFALVVAQAVTAAIPAQAQRTIDVVKAQTFDQKDGRSLAASALLYSENEPQDFTAWQAQHPVDGQLLSLYPGYTEPTVVFVKNGERKEQPEPLVIYETKIKTVLNRPASSIKDRLPGMISLESIKALDKTIQHREIKQDEFIQNVVGRKPVTNFDWCGKNIIVRPKKEVDLGHLQAHSYCVNSANSRCVESCYVFGKEWQAGVSVGVSMADAKAALSNVVSGGSSGDDESEKKDYGVGIQSEVRYFLNEADYGNKVPLAQLTRINTPVRGILEQNMFYFNQVFQYGKVLVVLQEDPADANKTIMSSFAVLGIKKRSWIKYGSVLPEIMAGESLFNMGEGLTRGVPSFTQGIANETAQLLEK